MRRLILAIAAPLALAQCAAPGPSPNTSFFITSTGIGGAANLGGLAGADAHCQALAQSAGIGQRRWRAYLSTQGAGAVNARDRIGRGPWRNAAGTVIATDVANLHGDNNLTKMTALTERGAVVNGRGDTPNTHDILTGSTAEGTTIPGTGDSTCRNWTHAGADGSAMLGHSDRIGLRDDAASRSWNASHMSRACSADALRATGGAGLFYCFAAD